MTIKERRFVALFAAALVLLVSVAPILRIPILGKYATILWLGGFSLLGAVDHAIPPGVPGQNLNTNIDRDTFESLATFGLGLAAALSIVYVFWDRRPAKKAITISYFAFLIVLTSMSCANFATGDSLLNRKAQALIDPVLVTLGLIVIIELLRLRPASTIGVVLRAVIVFLILFQAIALPGIYGVLWYLNWQGAIASGQGRDLNPGWISAVAAVASALVAFLNYRTSQNALHDKIEKEQPRIIVA